MSRPITIFLLAVVVATTGLIVVGLNLQKAAFEGHPGPPAPTLPASHSYADVAHARAAGAFGPGRLPDILPDDATDIWVQQSSVAYFTAPSGFDPVRSKLEALGARRIRHPIEGVRPVGSIEREEYELHDGNLPVLVELGVSGGRRVRLGRGAQGVVHE